MAEQRRHGRIVPAALFGEERFGYRLAGSSPKRFPKIPYQRRPSIRVIQNSSIPIPRVLGAGIIALAVNVLLLGLASHFGIDTAGGAFQRLIKLWTTPLFVAVRYGWCRYSMVAIAIP